MRLRTGRELAVVDISPSGALVEGATRLLPGTHVDVHVVTRHGRALVRTRVVRSSVWQLQADAVSYRTALAFDAAVDTEVEVDGYPLPIETPVIEGVRAVPTRATDVRALCGSRSPRELEDLAGAFEWHRVWLLMVRRCVALAVEVGGE